MASDAKRETRTFDATGAGATEFFQQMYIALLEPKIAFPDLSPVVVIHGARAFGKSDLLRVLKASLSSDTRRAGHVDHVDHVDHATHSLVTEVDGKAIDEASATIMNFVHSDQLQHRLKHAGTTANVTYRVLIDNLDRLLKPPAQQTELGQMSYGDLLKWLDTLLKDARAGKGSLQVILTTTRDPGLLVDPNEDISAILTEGPIYLNDQDEDMWIQIVTKTIDKIAPREGAREETRVQTSELAKEIVSRSGSHPALMAAGLNALQVMHQEKLLEPGKDTFKNIVSMLHNAMLYGGSAVIRRQLSRYRMSDVAAERDAMDQLQKHLNASGSSSRPFGLRFPAGEILSDAGVVRQASIPGNFIIPGAVLTEMLRVVFQEDVQVPRTKMVFRSRADTRGEIEHLDGATGSRSVILTENAWTITKLLLETPGRVVRLQEIKEALEKRTTDNANLTDKGVATAVGRFILETQKLFGDYDNRRLVRNVRGVGYQLVVDHFEIEDLTSKD